MKPVDYRKFRLSGLKTPAFRHLLLLLYWPVFGLIFYSIEFFPDRFPNLFPVHYHPVYWAALDEKIPFSEWFFIPYIYWFAFIGWFIVYSIFFDIPAFKKYMHFVIAAYSMTLLIYFIFPTEQNLRKAAFEQGNLLEKWVGMFYAFDTNTNVCPSLHVTGSLAVAFAAWDSKRYRTVGWRIFFMASAVVISLSTVLIKQHSIIDVFVSLALCGIIYPFVFIDAGPFKKLFHKKRSVSC